MSQIAEFHSQTAIECAQRINKKLKSMGKSAEDIDTVTNRTHEACIRIIDKQLKPMDNFADRDHCVQVRQARHLPSTTYLQQLAIFLFLMLTVYVPVHGSNDACLQPA